MVKRSKEVRKWVNFHEKILLLFNYLFALLFLTVACYEKADIEMSEFFGRTEEDLRELDVVETTVSSFDGESIV